MWSITKEFDFCYGHRVWNQKLDSRYSVANTCACRHLHGHQGKIAVTLEASELINGMVTDFNHLNWFKEFINNNLDHKFIIDLNDPMYATIVPHNCYGVYAPALKQHPEGHMTVDPNFFKFVSDPNLIELLEGFVILNHVPTSEYLSQWLYNVVDEKMSVINITTKALKFFETPKTFSEFKL